MAEKAEQEHAALGPFAGFFYQWHYFMLRALSMQKGESVSFEDRDDVDATSNEHYQYYQLKHTVKATNEKVVNMPKRDGDWWKTIAVWIEFIKDKGDDEAQNGFINRTEFTLVTNKTVSHNELYDKIIGLQSNQITSEELDLYISEIYKATKGPKRSDISSVKKHIEILKDYPYRHLFLQKVKVETISDDDILQAIMDESIEGKFVDKDRVEESLRDYFGQMEIEASKVIPNGVALSFTRKEFQLRFQHCFTPYHKCKITFQKFEREHNLDLSTATFIQQLIDIGDITIDDTEEILDYADSRFDYDMSMSESVRKHEISTDTRKEIEDVAYKYWRQKFRFYNLNTVFPDEESKKIKARLLLDNVRDYRLNYEEQQFDAYQSNGCFYTLSDGTNPRIGWHVDWKQKYIQTSTDGQTI